VLTGSLIAAVKRWQRDSGLPATGRIAVGDAVVLTGDVRVDAVTAQLGDSASGPLMSVTPTAKVITVAAEPTDAASIARGDPVTVVLPNEKKARGKVTAVGTAVQAAEGAGEEKPTLSVTVTLDDAKAVSKLTSAQVQVEFVAETHAGVLAAPVGALVALREGGYAVQLAGGGLVAVQTGMFSKGLVEVTGDGLTEGAAVVTTS
jgi:hypothetical protein